MNLVDIRIAEVLASTFVLAVQDVAAAAWIYRKKLGFVEEFAGGRVLSRLMHPLAAKPWGMREFAIVTPDGHRIVFGEEMQTSPAAEVDTAGLAPGGVAEENRNPSGRRLHVGGRAPHVPGDAREPGERASMVCRGCDGGEDCE
ncbi:MAG: hypothetical protein U0840_02885 [Gemmataceae bacterium]